MDTKKLNKKGIAKKQEERSALFYMANAYPEIGRVFKYEKERDKEGAEAAKDRALSIIDTILSRQDISPAGREEWTVARSMLLGYLKLDDYAKNVLQKFAEPFSLKFMYEYANGNTG